MDMIVVRKSKLTGNSVMASYRAGSLRNVCTTFNNGVILQTIAEKQLIVMCVTHLFIYLQLIG